MQQLVRRLDWGSVLLIEGSPWVARRLKRSIRARNPFPRVPAERVFVSNSGVCPNSMLAGANASHDGGVELPYYSLTATGRGLPSWSTQLGGYRKWHVVSRLKQARRHRAIGVGMLELRRTRVVSAFLFEAPLSALRAAPHS